MSQIFHVHPDNPQGRLLAQAAKVLHQGGVIVYPTDSSYAIGCHMGTKQAIMRIRKLRDLSEKHHFTLLCRDLSELGRYANVNNQAYRMIKALTPGPFTFLLPATKSVPKLLMHPKRKTIGLRVPDNRIAQDFLQEVGEPIMSTTLQLPCQTEPCHDPDDFTDLLENQVDIIINGGICGLESSTVIDFIDDAPALIRQGKGDASDYFA